MALLYGRTLLDTLHERVGDEEADLRNQPRLNGVATGAWGRVIGQHGNNDGDPLGVFGSGPKFDYNIGAFQGGQDLLRRDGADGSRDHAGLYAAIGLLTGDVTHFDRTFAGANNLRRPTASAATGPISVRRGGISTRSCKAPGMMSERVHQFSSADHQRMGFCQLVRGRLPDQARLAASSSSRRRRSSIKMSAWATAAIPRPPCSSAMSNSVAARIGARFARTWSLDDSAQLRSITGWIRPSLWTEFRGDPQTLFSSAAGPVPFQSYLGGSWFELNVGMDAKITAATSLFANVGYQISTNGNITAYNGKMGLRMAW